MPSSSSRRPFSYYYNEFPLCALPPPVPHLHHVRPNHHFTIWWGLKLQDDVPFWSVAVVAIPYSRNPIQSFKQARMLVQRYLLLLFGLAYGGRPARAASIHTVEIHVAWPRRSRIGTRRSSPSNPHAPRCCDRFRNPILGRTRVQLGHRHWHRHPSCHRAFVAAAAAHPHTTTPRRT